MFVRCGAESHYGKGRIRSRSSSLSAVHREDLRYRTGRTHAAIHLDLKGNRLKRIVKRSNAQLSTGPKTPEGKKTLVLECLPTRPYRPDRHSHTRRPGSLPTALRRHPRSPRSGRRPRNRSRPSNRKGPLATQPRRALENAIFTLGLQEHSDPNAATPKSTRFRSRPHLDRPGKKPPAPHGLRTAHPPLRRKNMAELRALQAGRKAAIERAETEAACSSNSQSTKAITTIQPTISRPNLSPLGSFFRDPKSCAKSSATAA